MVAGTGLVRLEQGGTRGERNRWGGRVRVWADRGIILAAYLWIVERIITGLLAEIGGGPVA